MAIPGKSKWWKNPVVIGPIIVAIIGGIFAMSAAFIQRTDSKPNVAEPARIEQQSHGPGSPNVGHTGGNVTIQQQEGGATR
jgi:hypothetical protein